MARLGTSVALLGSVGGGGGKGGDSRSSSESFGGVSGKSIDIGRLSSLDAGSLLRTDDAAGDKSQGRTIDWLPGDLSPFLTHAIDKLLPLMWRSSSR